MGRIRKSYIFEKIPVIDAGGRGKSVAKSPDGRVIFLTNAIPGDVVDIQTGKKRKSYFEGKAIHFHKYSDKRTKPVCTHFEYCGGCKWQHMRYEHQLYYKEKEVLENFRKIGNITWQEQKPILEAKQPYFYRNKMEFSFSSNRWLTFQELNSNKDIEDKNALGFHIAGMWDKVLDIEKCYLQQEPSNQIRNAIKKFAIEQNLSFYNPKKAQGMLRTMMLRISSTGEIMVVIQMFKENRQKRILLLDYILQKFPQITSLQYIINSKANDTIYDQKVILYHGKEYIFEQMENLRFKINAKSFYQTNSQQAYRLYKVVRNFAALTGEELVYDLYTGTGTIAQFIAHKAKKIIGIESVPEAIKNAKENAEYNKIDNVHFFVGDIKNRLTETFVKKNGRPQVIVADPPREGMHPKVVAQILKIAPKRIVYVSCNSATQARDLNLMKEKYRILQTQAVDMFPQTHHVENVVLLEKNSYGL